jgi:hypothetical protein
MNTLLLQLLQRLRPRIGWVQFALGVSVVLCTALAASNSKLNLPSNAFSWAGLPIALRHSCRAPVRKQPGTAAARPSLTGVAIARGAPTSCGLSRRPSVSWVC